MSAGAVAADIFTTRIGSEARLLTRRADDGLSGVPGMMEGMK